MVNNGTGELMELVVRYCLVFDSNVRIGSVRFKYNSHVRNKKHVCYTQKGTLINLNSFVINFA